MKSFSRMFAGTAVALALGVGGAASVSADDVAEFYKGKRIQVIIGSGPGGGYDTYARLVTRHLGRHIPGNPSLNPQNMPGAGGVVGANFVANVAPKDGTVIAGTQREIPLIEILGQEGPRYKAAKLNWLGSLSSEPGVCAVATRTGIESFGEVFERNFVIGGTGPNITEFHPAMLNNLLGARFKLIKGYPATPQIHMAVESGEVDAICQSWGSFKKQAAPMLEAGTIKPMVQMSLRPDPEMTKRGLPMIFDFVTEDRVQPGFTVKEAKAYFTIVMSTGFAGRPFFTAAEVPEDRVKALRKAFVDMAADPEFQADADKQKRDVDFVPGDELQKIVVDMAETPPQMLAQVDSLMEFKGPTEQVKIKMVRHTGKVLETKRGGREIVIDYEGKPVSASISGSRTKVTIDGKDDKRGNVKPGMTCTFVYPSAGSQAEELDCKS